MEEYRGASSFVLSSANTRRLVNGMVFVSLFVVAMSVGLTAPSSAAARSPVIREGAARFEVLTPTLVRMEYAQDRAFQNAPTQVASRRRLPRPRFTTRVDHGWRVIRTARLTLRYRRGSGVFSAANLRATFGGRTIAPIPGGDTHPLGGWTRALDVQSGPVPLHPGILSRDGWHVVDDTSTALVRDARAAARPTHAGAYRDWYLFAYGDGYGRALNDLRALTGPAPLLPRGAFGVWFSKYFPYSATDLQGLRADFRNHGVPLDTLSIDTDYKRVANPVGAAAFATVLGTPGKPASWNGWDWNRDLFPDPKGFVDWAHQQGLSIALNIHPSIDTNDPAYPQTVGASGPLSTDSGMCRILQADPTGECKTFDWTRPQQLNAYFALHEPFKAAGADLFWLDWCCEGAGSADTPGLTPDTWINAQYARHQRERGQRWPAFSRIGAGYADDGVDGDRGAGAGGALAEHRSTIQFTGDTCASWSMLAFEAEMTAAEGAAIGLPYVSHDIGSFNGVPGLNGCNAITGALDNTVPSDLYARWVQFATFQPLDRLHSNHGRRLPWEYPGEAAATATRFLRLREALVPTSYTLAREAHDTGLPMTRPMYLTWPRQAEAYTHPTQYSYGHDLVVAPVTAAGDPANVTLWVPPGRWNDLFTGERFTGPATRTLSVPLNRMPVLVRAGAIVATQPVGDHTSTSPAQQLTLSAYPGRSGSGWLYDDAGTGFGYERGAFTRTRFRQRRTAGKTTVVIGRPRVRRTWTVRIIGVGAPRRVTVNGRRVRASWAKADRTLTVSVQSARRVVIRTRQK